MNIFDRVSFLEKLLFTKHLGTMVKSGIPIAEALDVLRTQTKSTPFRKVLSGILASVENGQTLSKSFGKYPKVFNEFYLSLIEIGEESGTLESNLEFLAEQLAKDYALRKKVLGALLYPALVVSAAVIMGGFISIFILPKLVDFFSAFDVELPMTTKILLFVSIAMRDYGVFIAAGLVVLTVMAFFALKIKKVKSIWHSLVLRLPLFGEMLAYGQLARFSRNFGVLLKSGVPIARALEVVSGTLSNLKFKNDLKETAKSHVKGKSIGVSLAKYKEYPPIVNKMISVGEKTGKLDETLLYLGDFYEDEIDSLSKNLTTILEPILLITIGLVVGFIALAIITPIYELTGSVRR